MIKKNILLISLVFITILAYEFILNSGDKVRIFLIGDSTMADKPLADNPERGWGQLLPVYFNENVEIKNHARNGRSTKSFIDEGRWEAVLNELKQGDYLFIQFGHNDAKKSDSTRYADPWNSYKKNLIKFIRESRQKYAIPILITPVHRRKFDESGKLIDQHGDYPKVVREVAGDKNVFLIDLHKKSEELFNKLGVEKTKDIFLYNRKEKEQGKKDNTHFTYLGAVEIAGLVADEIKVLGISPNDFLKKNTIKNIEKNITVGLDYYFNNEWKETENGKKIRYHYTWEDEENSGYHELGKLFMYRGAELKAVENKPDKNLLKSLDIYIIVDPDTPAETENPNYIDEQSIKNIKEWVNSGGTLVLMANDSANCEFDYLNNLAEEFGIHFNGDSKNKVTGKEYDMGKFTELPPHPVFENVNKIYMKEISTLSLSNDAKEILSNEENIVIAVSNFGKGHVVAVGDPWLYNEYIDNRKLPGDFENYKAAKNFVNWLLFEVNL